MKKTQIETKNPQTQKNNKRKETKTKQQPKTMNSRLNPGKTGK